MKRILTLTALLLALAGCVTLSEEDRFLLEGLDDQGKAQALTDAGIEQYEAFLVQRAEYEQIPAVRRYFDTALRYDPGNATAKRYLDLVDDYRASRLRTSVREADRLLAKRNRTEDETYALCVAVLQAVRLDPEDDDARRLDRLTVDIRLTLVQTLLKREEGIVAKIAQSKNDDASDRLWAEAYVVLDRALDIDPANEAVAGERARASVAVEAAGEKRMAAIRELIAQGKFTAARTAITALSDLNRRSDRMLETPVRDATYELNFRWAKWYFDQKQYDSAVVKIDAALRAMRTADALALKKRIEEGQAENDALASFDAGLKEADRLLAAGELVAAWRRLDALTRSTKDPRQLDLLDTRRAKVRGFLPDLYSRGVEAYRQECFREAIEALEIVVLVDEGWEQAAEYLEKARSKLKLLEQY